MKKLIIYVGPPCSGKSTRAKEYKNAVDSHVVIANRDNIRFEIGNGKYDQNHEQEVTNREVELVTNAMEHGRTVILDDTNLNPKYIQPWHDLAEKYGYEVEKEEFYVSYQEAMARSKKRKEEGGLYIPKNVMLSFYKRYYPEQLKEELTDKRIIKEQDTSLPQCVICDLDATLALHQGREPFDWDLIPTDKIDPRLHNLLITFSCSCIDIIFVTGRPEQARKTTEEWLEKNLQPIKKYKLFMRKDSDFSHGDDYKRNIYKENIEGQYNVLCVFEDSNKCVRMWREEGLLTCQVENNDY